jgi:hypothetical protein
VREKIIADREKISGMANDAVAVAIIPEIDALETKGVDVSEMRRIVDSCNRVVLH